MSDITLNAELPTTAAGFVKVAEDRPGLVENLAAGSIDAFVEFFELSGAHITSVAAHELVK